MANAVIVGLTAEDFVVVGNEYRALSIIKLNELYFLKLTGLAIKCMVICLSVYLKFKLNNYFYMVTPSLPTAFLTKRSEQSWSGVYKKYSIDQKFWAKILWSEVYKNCVCDQIQWSEMTKIFDYYCSLKILRQIII